MKQDPLITSRFENLIQQANGVLATKVRSQYTADYVDSKAAEEWATCCISFIGRVLGRESEHYSRFEKHYTSISTYSSAVRALGVLTAAYEDYKGGYLFTTVKRIQAEIFDDFLEQAECLLRDGYFAVAAVVAGAVLEDTLRKLCLVKGIALPAQPKLDSMNSELSKIGAYDKLVQKRVTLLADIRNKAAHGKWSEFSQNDVEEMIKATRRFIEEQT